MSAGAVILTVILVLLAFLFFFPIRICLSFSDDGFAVRVKLLFWTLPVFPQEEKVLSAKQQKKKEQKAQRRAAKKADQKARADAKRKAAPAEPRKKRSLREWLELLRMIAESGGRLARRFWKGLVVDKLTLHMAVAGSDAADAAISYGRLNAQVYTAYAFLSQFVTLKNTDIRLVPDFLSDESRIEVSGELFFRVGTLLASCFAAVWHLIRLLIRAKNAENAERDVAV